MGSVVIIFSCILFMSAQNISQKQYSLKYHFGGLTFSTMITFFALLFFVLTSGGLVFETEFLPYSLAFGISYAVCTVTLYLAITCGSLAITTLIQGYSLVIPTLYGLVVLKEEAGLFQYAGFLILVISLYLVRESDDANSTTKVTPKWIFYVVIAFVTNGMCSVIQNAQEKAFDGAYNSPFMVAALCIGVVGTLLAALLFERKDFVKTVKKGVVYAGLCGVANGIVNALVMVAVGMMASSIFFPVLSAGSMIFAFLIAVFLYKEKFVPRQIAGIACGIVALIFFNI